MLFISWLSLCEDTNTRFDVQLKVFPVKWLERRHLHGASGWRWRFDRCKWYIFWLRKSFCIGLVYAVRWHVLFMSACDTGLMLTHHLSIAIHFREQYNTLDGTFLFILLMFNLISFHATTKAHTCTHTHSSYHRTTKDSNWNIASKNSKVIFH